jgi:eukaryotic-like serine/threonine-protein kinase
VNKRCPNCGREYGDEANFCTRDGTRLVVPTPAAPDLVGQTLDDRYDIQRKLGEGGMGLVYLADDKTSHETVAIKVLMRGLSRDPKAMVRLRREAAYGMRLAHPNICHIIRMGQTADGATYVVMPYVEGEVLVERTHRLGQIPIDEAVRLVGDIAAGLHAAHDAGIVHRDLKPENVMVRSDADGVHAVVMDFGLAKAHTAGRELEKLTATGIVLGTPEFMSPEQLRGKTLDRRSDVYALGLVTYEMLTGQLPFDGRTQQALMIARLKEDPKPLRKARPDLSFPRQVDIVLEKAMRREPNDRYQTAVDFAKAFAAAVNDGGSP